jgi:hypothetical protein
MKNKDFVGYEESLVLKGLGFDEPCFGYYHEDMSISYTGVFGQNTNSFWLSSPNKIFTAPLYSQAFRWFREKYGYHFQPFVDDNQTFGYLITYFTDEGRIDKPIKRGFKTPEEAELVCLRQLIEILKEKNK